MNAELDRTEDFDIGRLGFPGHFDSMCTILQETVPQLTQVAALWVWFAALPSSFDYQLSNVLTARTIGLVAIGIFAAKIAWRFLTSLWHCGKWLALEARGLRWVRVNDQDFRVSYYKASDGTLDYDKKTRKQRNDEERSFSHYRRQSLLRDGARLIFYLAIATFMPFAFELSYGVIETQWQYGSQAQAFAAEWHILPWSEWLWLLFFIIPVAVKLLVTLFAMAAYNMDANYISGAKVRDPFVQPKTLETVREEKVHGDARFVDEDEAIRSMGDDE